MVVLLRHEACAGWAHDHLMNSATWSQFVVVLPYMLSCRQLLAVQIRRQMRPLQDCLAWDAFRAMTGICMTLRQAKQRFP